MLVLKIRGKRTNLFLLAREISRGHLLHMGFRDRAVTIKAKAKVNHPKMGGISKRLANQVRGRVSIVTSLDT